MGDSPKVSNFMFHRCCDFFVHQQYPHAQTHSNYHHLVGIYNRAKNQCPITSCLACRAKKVCQNVLSRTVTRGKLNQCNGKDICDSFWALVDKFMQY